MYPDYFTPGIDHILGIVSLLLLAAGAFLLTRMTRPRGRIEFALVYTLVITTVLVLLGYLGSGLNLLNRAGYWAAAGVLSLGLICIPLWRNRSLRAACLRPLTGLGDLRRRLSGGVKSYPDVLLLLLVITVAVVAVANLIVALGLEPPTPDVQQYHLARVARYLQYGNLHHYDTTYWAQVTHPKISAIVQLYLTLIAGVNGKVAQLSQFFAYVIALAAVYGSARELGGSRRGSLFAACAFGLLTIVILQGATAQNDLIVTAFAGCAGYFLLAYRSMRRPKYLALAAPALALGLGVKETMLFAVPSLLVIGWFALRAPIPESAPAGKRASRKHRSSSGSSPRLRHVAWGGAALCLALAVLTIPSGYGENVARYGTIVGPDFVQQKHANGAAFFSGGLLNLLRDGVDALNLDGLPEYGIVTTAQRVLHGLPRPLLSAVGIDLAAPEGSNVAFRYADVVRSESTQARFGLLGFLLLWPVVWWSLFRPGKNPAARWLAIAAMTGAVVLAFASPYEFWRARYLMTTALWSAPLLALRVFPPRSRFGKIYLGAVVLLVCLSGIGAALYRWGTFLLPISLPDGHYASILSVNPSRSLQFARESSFVFEYRQALEAFEYLTPRKATVAIDAWGMILPEYALFGEHLGRTLVTIRPFDSRYLRPIPAGASALVYTPGLADARQGDTELRLWTGKEVTVVYRRLR